MVDSEEPRTKLLKGYRWPKDRHGEDVDVGDYLLFTNYTLYPIPAFGRVIRVGKTGKVHVKTISLHTRDPACEIEIKRCDCSAVKIGPVMLNAVMFEKLSKE